MGVIRLFCVVGLKIDFTSGQFLHICDSGVSGCGVCGKHDGRSGHSTNGQTFSNATLMLDVTQMANKQNLAAASIYSSGDQEIATLGGGQ
ncbi:hypothetical protein [Paenibacillus cremeus]|uniref:Uncharacterized protein n=1 Tax=Paenibacillus cremeus TaxID=2163881 RepID=A0A559K581_9BACL|nr:hypothetical protein [Paenibacillus cremeus]TVY07257.1 hypothetical protein FPZ49_24815 [Paenibacillus cremeus]